jgi:hypothetical protein
MTNIPQLRRFTPSLRAALQLAALAVSAAACVSEADLLKLKEGEDKLSNRGQQGGAWESCDPEGDMLSQARTGDACSFGNSSCAALSPQCVIDQATCQDGVLYRTAISRGECVEPPRADAAWCAGGTEEACCAYVYSCDDGSRPESENRYLCVRECESLRLDPAVPLVSACPGGGSPWVPAPGTPCQGDFVCDLLGYPFDDQPQPQAPVGTVYFCAHGVLQRVALTSPL